MYDLQQIVIIILKVHTRCRIHIHLTHRKSKCEQDEQM